MKPHIRLLVVTGLTICATLWAMLGTARAQIFVSNAQSNSVGEYTTNGVTVNAALVSGLDEPFGIAVVPEPATLALAGFGGLSLLLCLRRRK